MAGGKRTSGGKGAGSRTGPKGGPKGDRSGMGGRGDVGGPGDTGRPITGNLFVDNLPDEATEEMVREQFALLGTVTTCRVFKRGERTCGVIRMSSPQEAEAACKISNDWVVTPAPPGPKGKGKGKFMWMGFWGKGKGKGKGKSDGQMMLRVDPSLKVWIGNLAEGVSWKDLQTHMNQAGKTTWVEVFTGSGKGTGAVVYSAIEEVANAIATLNGTEIGGQELIVDVWTKASKPAVEEDGAPASGEAASGVAAPPEEPAPPPPPAVETSADTA